MGLFGGSVGLLGGSVGLLGGFVGFAGGLVGGLLGGLFVAGTGVFRVFGDLVEVFVGRKREEPVLVGEAVAVAVGVSSGLTGSRGISAM